MCARFHVHLRGKRDTIRFIRTARHYRQDGERNTRNVQSGHRESKTSTCHAYPRKNIVPIRPTKMWERYCLWRLSYWKTYTIMYTDILLKIFPLPTPVHTISTSNFPIPGKVIDSGSTRGIFKLVTVRSVLPRVEGFRTSPVSPELLGKLEKSLTNNFSSWGQVKCKEGTHFKP